MVITKITASMERQKVLKENGIGWKIDTEFNFVFKDVQTKNRAVKLMRAALVL